MGAAAVAAVAVIVGSALLVRRGDGGDYAQVEQLRAEQDEGGTHDEHVRQRFYRLYKTHPQSAMYTYLWARCVDDASDQLALAREGMTADPRFSWNYNMAARALARLGKIPEAYEQATKGAAIDPGNMELAEKVAALKVMIDHRLTAEPRLGPSASPVRFTGLLRSRFSAERVDLQAIEATRKPDPPGPIGEAVHGFAVCSNPYADACLRVYVAKDDRFKGAWPAPSVDVGSLKDRRLVTVSGPVVETGAGEAVMVADAITVEPH